MRTPVASCNADVSLLVALRRQLADSSLRRDIKQYFAANDSPRLIKEFTRRIDIPFDRAFPPNVHSIGNPWSCDTVINLYNHCRYEPPQPGDNFRACADLVLRHWSCCPSHIWRNTLIQVRVW